MALAGGRSMSVYDRWHTKKPRLVDGQPVSKCREHKQYPSTEHGKGDRWQVRWRDETGKQYKQNFSKKAGSDPNTCADAFDAKVHADLHGGTYIDPLAGKIAFKTYAEQWLTAQTFDEGSRDVAEYRLRLHAFPDLGDKQLGTLAKRPSIIQAWLRSLLKQGLAPNYVRVIFAHVSTVFSAAVADGLIPKNPCTSSSVRVPKRETKKIVPWSVEWVAKVAEKITKRYADMVNVGGKLGLRQGEAFGLGIDDIDFENKVVHVRRQVKVFKGWKLVFAPPKGGKTRDLPLPDVLAALLKERISSDAYPPVEITLPWKTPDGKPETVALIFTTRQRGPINRNDWNRTVWKPALERAGIPTTRDNGFHALRHHFASVLLAGEWTSVLSLPSSDTLIPGLPSAPTPTSCRPAVIRCARRLTRYGRPQVPQKCPSKMSSLLRPR